MDGAVPRAEAPAGADPVALAIGWTGPIENHTARTSAPRADLVPTVPASLFMAYDPTGKYL